MNTLHKGDYDDDDDGGNNPVARKNCLSSGWAEES